MNYKCSQCDKPAMYQVEGNLLCLSCYSKFVEVGTRQL